MKSDAGQNDVRPVLRSFLYRANPALVPRLPSDVILCILRADHADDPHDQVIRRLGAARA